MDKISKLALLLFLSIGTSCHKDEVSPLPTVFTQLEGRWQFEEGILDGMEVEEWSEASMKISIVSDSSIKIICANQPLGRVNIWPEESTLYLKKLSERSFYRNDEIDVLTSFFESKLTLSMQPPREWSYDEECDAPEVSAFQCSNEGTWYFVLNKDN
jgi:hypothetical protein